MHIRKIAAAASFATGAALALAPLASADTSSDWLSAIDGFLSGASPAASMAGSDFQISFDGTDLFPTTGNLATATTAPGEFGLAIAYGVGASATAEGGTGDYALASGTDALAKAGSTTAGATGFNDDSAIDIGNNTPSVGELPDGAYAGGGSLAGYTDSATASSNDSAIDIGNNGVDSESPDGGDSGAFAGDAELNGFTGSGSGDTAYTYGDLNGHGDGSAAVGGDDNYASVSGNETGSFEGAEAAFGNDNSAIADTTYTTDDDGVFAGYGNDNYAYVYGPDNSTAEAGGTETELSNNNIAYVTDPFASTTSAADSATAGASSSAAGGSDLAEVLYTHGDAVATGTPALYDILSLFGDYTNVPASAAAESGGLLAELGSLF